MPICSALFPILLGRYKLRFTQYYTIVQAPDKTSATPKHTYVNLQCSISNFIGSVSKDFPSITQAFKLLRTHATPKYISICSALLFYWVSIKPRLKWQHLYYFRSLIPCLPFQFNLDSLCLYIVSCIHNFKSQIRHIWN